MIIMMFAVVSGNQAGLQGCLHDVVRFTVVPPFHDT